MVLVVVPVLVLPGGAATMLRVVCTRAGVGYGADHCLGASYDYRIRSRVLYTQQLPMPGDPAGSEISPPEIVRVCFAAGTAGAVAASVFHWLQPVCETRFASPTRNVFFKYVEGRGHRIYNMYYGANK